jgi:hypothetical protein
MRRETDHEDNYSYPKGGRLLNPIFSAGIAQASSLDLNSQERMIHRRAVEAII